MGINGFGRIGRLLARFCLEPESPLQLVHVNDIHGDASTAAYLLQFDSVHGRLWGMSARLLIASINFNRLRLKEMAWRSKSVLHHILNQTKFPWKDLGVSLVLECTGALKQKIN